MREREEEKRGGARLKSEIESEETKARSSETPNRSSLAHMVDEMPVLVAFTDSVPYSSSSSDANDSSFVTSPTTTAAVAEDRWVELTMMCIKSLIFGTIIIGAVLGNALVIISVQRNRKLRLKHTLSALSCVLPSCFHMRSKYICVHL